MNPDFFDTWSTQSMATFGLGFGLVLLLLVVWSLYWKGRALWRAARCGESGWFVALLLLNTLGILDIIYLFLISERTDTKKKTS